MPELALREKTALTLRTQQDTQLRIQRQLEIVKDNESDIPSKEPVIQETKTAPKLKPNPTEVITPIYAHTSIDTGLNTNQPKPKINTIIFDDLKSPPDTHEVELSIVRPKSVISETNDDSHEIAHILHDDVEEGIDIFETQDLSYGEGGYTANDITEYTSDYVDYREINIVEIQPDIQLLQEAMPFINFDIFNDVEVAMDEEATNLTIVEQIYTFIETELTENAVEATAILDEIGIRIEQYYDVQTDIEKLERLDNELEIICTRLLVCIGVEPEPETIRQFILAIKKDYLFKQVSATDTPDDEGTHERKHAFDTVSPYPDYSSQNTIPALIGRYALSFA